MDNAGQPSTAAIREEVARLCEVAQRLVDRLDAERLRAAPVRPGQLHDTRIIEPNGDKFTRAATEMATIFCQIETVQKLSGDRLLITASGRAGGMVAVARAAFRKAVDIGQMSNPLLPVAGRLLSATVDDAGAVKVQALLSDQIARTKAQRQVYPGLSVRIEGDEIVQVDLVDRDISKLSKGIGAADTLIVKVYSNTTDERIAKMTAAEKRAMEIWAQEVLERPMYPDAGDARKRGEALETFKLLYRSAPRLSGRGDPRFDKWR